MVAYQYLIHSESGTIGPLSSSRMLELAKGGFLPPDAVVEEIGSGRRLTASRIRGYRMPPGSHGDALTGTASVAHKMPRPARKSRSLIAATTAVLLLSGIAVAFVVVKWTGASQDANSNPSVAQANPKSRASDDVDGHEFGPLEPARHLVDGSNRSAPSDPQLHGMFGIALEQTSDDDLDQPKAAGQSEDSAVDLLSEVQEPQLIHIPDGTPRDQPIDDELPAPQPAVLAHGPYLLFRLEHRIDDIAAEALENTLRYAHENDVPTVLLFIDSPGGYVAAGESMAAHIQYWRRHLNVVALVGDALSAACWPALAADYIVMADDATIGAAVPYSGDPSSGSAEVDAKFVSATAAKLASIASANQYNQDVVRAMVEMGRQLWTWRDPGTGQLQAGSTPPSDVEANLFCDSQSVLTLNAREARAFGLAHLTSDMGKLWRFAEWREVGEGTGTSMLERVQSRVEAEQREHQQQEEARLKAIERAREWTARLPAYIDDASRSEPSMYSDYYYFVQTGYWDEDSRVRWRNRTDAAINKWRSVRAGIKDIADKIKEAGIEEDVPTVKSWLEERYSHAQLRIIELQRHRDRDR